MLFTQFNMDDALEVSYEEGFEDGFEDGRAEGENRMLVQLVCRLLQRGTEVAVIAEELDEEQITIKKIAQIVEDTGLYDAEQVYEVLKAEQTPA